MLGRAGATGASARVNPGFATGGLDWAASPSQKEPLAPCLINQVEELNRADDTAAQEALGARGHRVKDRRRAHETGPDCLLSLEASVSRLPTVRLLRATCW